MINGDNAFSRMQQQFYDAEAAKWTPENRDAVVGKWDDHNSWEDYELLFKGIPNQMLMSVLDYGCGPGRCLEKYRDRFAYLDGADISGRCCYLARQLARTTVSIIWEVNGVDLQPIPYAHYDLIYSTICLQHIPVFAIREQLFAEFNRVLKRGGWFTAQMGFGDEGDPRGVQYTEERWYTQATNGECDVKVTDTEQLRSSLARAGFVDFSAEVRPVGPNDWHPSWVFFRARKP